MAWLWFALASAVCAAATAVLAKVGVRDINSNLATAIRTTVILVFAWGIVAAQGTYHSIPSINRTTAIFLGLSGIATGLSWLFYFRALQLGRASQVAPVDKLSVVFVALFAAVFLGEEIGWALAVGVTLIAAGSLIIALFS